jgi:hypothetical protein
MYVRKVRGQERIHPVKITSVQIMLAKKMGISIEQYVKTYVAMIAKQRRWKWFFKGK